MTHVAVTCALALLTAVYALTPEPARVEVDLSVSGGTHVALFVNDLGRLPLTQPLVPGERRKYAFDGIVEDIRMLRVDPTDAGGTTVDLHSIVVVGRDGILAQFGPRALAGWTTSALAMTGIDDTALHLRTTSPDPIMTTSMAIPVVRKSGPWTRWLPMVNVPDFSWRLAAASLLLLVVTASIDPLRRLYLPIAAAAAGLVIAILAVEARMPDGPVSGAVAVSRATFMGLSTRPALLASIALLVGGMFIGTSAARLDRRRKLGIEPASPTMRLGPAVGGLVVLALVTSPDLRAWASIISTRHFVPNWDSDNLTYWAYLIQNGKVPLRDFWHPYGGAGVFDLPFPTGPVLRWLYDFILFGVFFVGFGKGRGAVGAVLVTALLLMGQRLGMLPGIERYLLPLNIVLSYVLVDRDAPSASTRILFWCACAVALFIEPPQLVFAAVPIGFVIAADVVQRWGTVPSIRVWLGRRLRADFGVLMVMMLVFGVLLAVSGQFHGFLQFYGRLGDAVAYSAWPTGLPELRMTEFPRALFLVACSTILMAIGAYEYFAGGARRPYGEVLAGVGLVLLMVLQKHFMRWMEEQLFLLAVVCVMVLGVGWPGRRRVADYIVAGAILGAIAAMLAVKPTAPAVLAAICQSSSRALSDLALLAYDGTDAGAVNSARFAPERFGMYISERQVVDRLRARAGPGGDVRVFGLTDDPILYVLTGQPSVWMSNMYDASPIYRQARVVRWLREEAPPYTVFDPDRLVWDEFQKVVRVPLVFAEVVSSYVPFEVIGRFHVVRRRGPGEPLAMSYWREMLGSEVDVGRLASVSSFSGNPGCSSGCGDLLEVEVPAGGSGRVSVPMNVADLSFSLAFTREPSETPYRMLLDRVWFWDVAKRNGLPHAVGRALPPSVRIQVRSVRLKEGVLY